MHRKGHFGAALLFYTPLGFITSLLGFRQATVLGLVTVATLAMFPDQDQQIPGVKHRGITHTVWFALLTGLIIGVCGAYVGSVLGDAQPVTTLLAGLFGFIVGTLSVLSHIAADALTPMGITPFTPVDDRHYTLNVVRASNELANIVLLILGAAAGGLTVILPELL